MFKYVLIALDEDHRELMRFISMDISQTEHVIAACQQSLSLPKGALTMQPVPKRPETFGVKLDEALANKVIKAAKRHKVSARVFYYNALVRYISTCVGRSEYRERAQRLLTLIHACADDGGHEGTQGGPTLC